MVGVERRADDGAGEGRRTVFALLLLVVLAGQREFGFGDVHRLARRPEREDHHHARTDEEGEVGRNVLVERIHRHRGVAGVAGDLEGVPAGDRYADEVHQIVSGEGEREGEGAAQDRDAQDVDLETLDEEEDEAACQPADQQREKDMVFDRMDEGRLRQRPFESLEECEVDDRRERCAAPQRAVAAQGPRVTEREDQAGDVHHGRTHRQRDDHREQDRRDDAECTARVDELAQVSHRKCVAAGDLEGRNGDRGAQQAEDERHGGRGGKPPRIVEVQQNDVGEHHAQIEQDHLVEGEHPRIEHSVARHLHHAARRERADQDSDRCHDQDHAAGGRLRSDGRVEEIYGVVGDADEEA
jgi:hypothetical protein